jgi:hypothetical protein
VAEDRSRISHKGRAALPEDDEWPLLPDGWPSFTRPLLRTSSGAPIDFDPSKWTPIQDGFTRIRAVVGERTAVRDLQADLRSGRQVMARRWVSRRDGARWSDPPDGPMLCEQLTPSFWEGGNYVYTRPWPNDWTQIEVLDIGQDASSLYYLFRALLEQRYRLLGETSPAPTTPTAAVDQEPPLPPRKRGPANTHDWHTIDGKVMRYCFDADGRLAVPENESLITKAVLQDYADSDRDISETEVREAVRRVCAEARNR